MTVEFRDEEYVGGSWREGHKYRRFAKPPTMGGHSLPQSATGAFMLVEDHHRIYQHEREQHIHWRNADADRIKELSAEIESLRDALKAATSVSRPADYWLVLRDWKPLDVWPTKHLADAHCLGYATRSNNPREEFSVQPVWREVQVGDKLDDEDDL